MQVVQELSLWFRHGKAMIDSCKPITVTKDEKLSYLIGGVLSTFTGAGLGSLLAKGTVTAITLGAIAGISVALIAVIAHRILILRQLEKDWVRATHLDDHDTKVSIIQRTLDRGYMNQEAYDLIKRLADFGDAEWQFRFAEINMDPNKHPDGKENYDRGYIYYDYASEQGHAIASFKQGDMHESGVGVIIQDLNIAFSLYQKAFEQGYRKAAAIAILALPYDIRGFDSDSPEYAKYDQASQEDSVEYVYNKA